MENYDFYFMPESRSELIKNITDQARKYFYTQVRLPLKVGFQPILDIQSRSIFGYDSFACGANGTGTSLVMSAVVSDEIYEFDQSCRLSAIEKSKALNLRGKLFLNFLPHALNESVHIIDDILEACIELDFPVQNLIFNLIESEATLNNPDVRAALDNCKAAGLSISLDYAYHSNFCSQAFDSLRPDFIRLSKRLINNLMLDPVRIAIVSGVVDASNILGNRVIASGISCADELQVLKDLGVSLCQGTWISRPGLDHLPEVNVMLD